MFSPKMLAVVPFCAAFITVAGCGGASSNCTVTALNVTPETVTIHHTAAAPANSQQFAATNLFTGTGVCSANASALVTSNWTASDPSVHLSATPAPTVTATCTAAVPNPVTVKATSVADATLTGQASLTCR